RNIDLCTQHGFSESHRHAHFKILAVSMKVRMLGDVDRQQDISGSSVTGRWLALPPQANLFPFVDAWRNLNTDRFVMAVRLLERDVDFSSLPGRLKGNLDFAFDIGAFLSGAAASLPASRPAELSENIAERGARVSAGIPLAEQIAEVDFLEARR